MDTDKSDLTNLRNCSFKFRCTQTWINLEKTGDELVRFCKDCGKNVHLVKSLPDLYELIRSDFCVAIPLGIDDDLPENSENHMIGLITSINTK